MSTYTDPTDPSTERATHPVNVGHLVMGLAFLGLIGVWTAVQTDLVSTGDVRWLLPLPWVFAGAAGLIALAFAGRGRKRATVAAADPAVGPDRNDPEPPAATEEIR